MRDTMWHGLAIRVLCAGLGLPGAGVAAWGQASEGIEFFEKHIRPVLVENCYECHSDSSKKLKAGLRLDSRDGMLKGGDTGPAIVPGDVEKSLLIRAIRYADPNLQMPPKDRKLAEGVIEAFEAWVKMGAPDPRIPLPGAGAVTALTNSIGHWAFRPIRKPALPAVRDVGRVKTPVDAFILSRLEAQGLDLAPEADRRTLGRRIAYTLTGLPPAPADIESLVAGPSPLAMERWVDRLLDSPHYGERWGRHWLDIARYADTKGYLAGDEQRLYAYSYTYRDYVIRAFNADLPMDQFIVDQIAADRLDLGSDKRALAALGFLTLGRRFLNNVPDIIDDRIDVVTRGLMGLTVGCARCHNHKFDPISMADYYALYGVFSNSHEPTEKPLLGAPLEGSVHEAYLAEKRRRQEELDTFRANKVREGREQLRRRAGDYLLGAEEARRQKPAEFDRFAQERKLAPGILRRWMRALEEWAKQPQPAMAPWVALAALPEADWAAQAKALIAGFENPAESGQPVNRRVVSALAKAQPASLKEAAAAYGKLFQEADTLWQETLKAASAKPAVGEGTGPESLEDADWESLRQVLYAEGAPARLSDSETDQLLGDARPRLRQLRARVEEVDATHPGAPPRAMALADNGTIHKARIFVRGNPGNPGDEVTPRFLELVSGPNPPAFTNGSGRLELARSIASDRNPLTARVWVNRVWLQHFGRPLVRTPSDFGLRAEPPTHPELLDYLAAVFMEQGWSLKRLHRLILFSSAYQQSSTPRPKAARVDPENDLVWRMNRRRLDFESMRDTLLAVSGKLDTTQGGRSVEIAEPPYANRRAVYGFIERQNLPGLFRTFDFASPDTTSAQRFATTVPQQALFLLNSPFVIQQARELIARSELAVAESDAGRLRQLVRLAYQREAAPEETRLYEQFLQNQAATDLELDPRRQWQYGYGELDPGQGRIKSFAVLPHFNNYAWQGGAQLPDPKLNWVVLNAEGGHPGNSAELAAIRRWRAPEAGVLAIRGILEHPADQGDGVRGWILSSVQGRLGQWMVRHGTLATDLDGVRVQREEILDFAVECRENELHDSFQWAPVIRYLETSGSGQGEVPREWNAKTQFSGPLEKQPEPLTPWEELAQVVLVSNELFFVD